MHCFSEMLNIISVQQFVGHLHITCIHKNVILSQVVFTTSIYYNWKCHSNFVLKNAERIVTVDPGSKPDQKYARQRDRQKYVARIK